MTDSSLRAFLLSILQPCLLSLFRHRRNRVLSGSRKRFQIHRVLLRCDKQSAIAFPVEKGKLQLSEEDRAEEFSTHDRRQYDRSRLIVDVHFDGSESTGVASTNDMSLGGLYLTTQAVIPVGATLALRIPLGGRHIVVKGEVVYSNPNQGVGVRFHDLSEDARALMERELPAP